MNGYDWWMGCLSSLKCLAFSFCNLIHLRIFSSIVLLEIIILASVNFAFLLASSLTAVAYLL
jgi:hypothetical protein